MKYKLWMRTDTGEQFCIFADGNYHALQFIVGSRLAGIRENMEVNRRKGEKWKLINKKSFRHPAPLGMPIILEKRAFAHLSQPDIIRTAPS